MIIAVQQPCMCLPIRHFDLNHLIKVLPAKVMDVFRLVSTSLHLRVTCIVHDITLL